MFVNFQRIAGKNSISYTKEFLIFFFSSFLFFIFFFFLPECQFPKESSRGFEEHWRATRHISLYRIHSFGKESQWMEKERGAIANAVRGSRETGSKLRPLYNSFKREQS